MRTDILKDTCHVGIAKHALGGDVYNGDQCACWRRGSRITLCVVDGLGRGLYAEQAAKAAVAYVAGHLGEPLADIFAGCDAALRRTRGAAMGIGVVDADAQSVTYAGINNTVCMVAGDKTVHLRGSPGIVGGRFRHLTPETVPLAVGDLVVLYTDGLKTNIQLSGYPDLAHADVQTLAERILQDWGREDDDAAVLVFRYE